MVSKEDSLGPMETSPTKWGWKTVDLAKTLTNSFERDQSIAR